MYKFEDSVLSSSFHIFLEFDEVCFSGSRFGEPTTFMLGKFLILPLSCEVSSLA